MAFKEIVTKAVIGKAKKTSGNNYSLTTEQLPNTVLGCWVINHSFSAVSEGQKVRLSGEYDVNIWYSFDQDSKTAVSTKRFSYQELMSVPLKEDSKISSSSEIIVRCLKQPTVSNVEVKNGVVELRIEKEMGVEIVGDMKVKINVEEEEDDYEEIFDDIDDNIIENIDEDYLKEDSVNQN